MPFEAVNEELMRRLADTYSACRVGSTVTYSMLSRALGKDIRAHRYLLPRAMRIANVETGAVFRNVRNVGYERMPNKEAHGKGQAARRRARKIFRVSQKQIENSMRHANDLTPQEVRKGWSEITHLGLNIHMTYDRNAPVIPAEPLPPDPSRIALQSIDAMRDALGRTK
jgi:hypothetical protein